MNELICRLKEDPQSLKHLNNLSKSRRNIVHNGLILEEIFSWRLRCPLIDAAAALEIHVCYLVSFFKKKKVIEYAQVCSSRAEVSF